MPERDHAAAIAAKNEEIVRLKEKIVDEREARDEALAQANRADQRLGQERERICEALAKEFDHLAEVERDERGELWRVGDAFARAATICRSSMEDPDGF